MRSGKRNQQASKAAVKAARKAYSDMRTAGKLTRAEALAVIAVSDDHDQIRKFVNHQNKHVKHAALYKIDEKYRTEWQAARTARIAKTMEGV